MIDVLLIALLHGECRMLRSFHCAGTCALPPSWIRLLGDFLNRFPGRLLQPLRGKKPPAR